MSIEPDLKQCRHCGASIPAVAEMCASCGTSDPDGARLAEARAAPPARHVPNRAAWTVTRVIVWSNVGYLLFCLYVQWTHTPQQGALRSLISLDGLTMGLRRAGWYEHTRVVENGEWWRSITAVWLHGGLIHIGMNMFVFSRVGAMLEDLIGGRRLFVLYLLSGLGSTAAISIWYVGIQGLNGAPPMVGASGAIFGVLGALSAFALRQGTTRGRMVGKMLVRDILLMLLIGWMIPMVSNTGHIGGLIPGVLIGLFVGERFGDRLRAEGVSMWTIAAGICALVTVIALGSGVAFGLAHLGGGR